MATLSRDVAGVPQEAVLSLFFRSTATDLAGKTFSESLPRQPRASEVQTLLAKPGPLPRSASSPATQAPVSTLYSSDFLAHDSSGFLVDRELANSFRPRPKGKGLMTPTAASLYATSFACSKVPRVRSAVAIPENGMPGVIGPGTREDPGMTSSYSKWYKALPPEQKFATEASAHDGCTHWVGAGVSSGAKEFASTYGVEFRLSSPQPRSASSPTFATPAPTPQMSAKQMHSKVRADLMKTQYRRNHLGHKSDRMSGAAEFRQAIVGR